MGKESGPFQINFFFMPRLSPTVLIFRSLPSLGARFPRALFNSSLRLR